MSESQKLRKWVGVGYAATAALALIGGARAETPVGAALVPRDDRNTTSFPPALVQKEFTTSSRETAQYHALRELGMTDQQIREVMQREQQQKQKYDERQLTKQANPDDHLDGLSKLFEERPGKESREVKEQVPQSTKETHQGEQGKMAKLQALMDKIKAHPEARKLLASKEASPPSSEIAPTSPDKIDPKVLENTRRKLNEQCLQWLSVKGVLGSTTIVKGPLSGEGTTVELSLQAESNCGEGNVDNVQFNAGITYTCPSECKPGNGGSVGEVGVQKAVENGVPSTIENGQLSQAQIITAAFCQQVDSNGDVTAIVPPSSVSALVAAVGTYKGEVAQSPVQPVNFVS